MSSPFSLSNTEVYARWRDDKISQFPSQVSELVVEVKDLANLSVTEHGAICAAVKRAGFAVYKSSPTASKTEVRAFAVQFGLTNYDQNPYADEDAITALEVSDQVGRKAYIPYTNKALNWHTDGYYNDQARTIHAMILHCVRAAGEGGGENKLFDPEMAYVLMRDHDVGLIKALQHKSVMTIPKNETDDHVQRGDIAGPVFSVHETGALHMRYTARKRHVMWADNEATKRALAFLQETLDGPYGFQYRLEAGEGLISNNILHTRANFEDGAEKHQKRLMLRARFWDRLVL